MGRWQHHWLALGLAALAACSEEVPAWRIAATCPVQPAGGRHLEFGRSYTLRVDRPFFGDPPPTAELIEDGRVTGRISLDCVTTRVALDNPRWIGPGGATLFDQPTSTATPLGRLQRDAPVHSIATEADWHLVAVGGVPAGFVPAITLGSRPADLDMLPEFLAAAHAAGGADRIVEVLPDLKQKEREDARVAGALVKIVNGALGGGDRATAARILEALDHDELTSDAFAATACRLAVSGFAMDWDIGGDFGATCIKAPSLPEVYDVPVENERECPRDTELLGATVAGTATAWACHTPDANLLNRPVGEEIDLSYEARLDHVFVRDRFGRIADLIDDAGFIQARREGRWSFQAIHVVGLGVCLEWEDQVKAKTMRFLSCFPPPPTNPKENRELIKVAATRRDGSSWHKRWTVVRDDKGYVLCVRDDDKGNQAFRVLPGQIKKAKRWPNACEVTDFVTPATDR